MRIGLEAGPLSQWLYAGLKQAGLAVELLKARHVRTAFNIMPVKTDRKDARGIAQLMRLGSLTFASAIDDSRRFKSSKSVGPLFGLTARAARTAV